MTRTSRRKTLSHSDLESFLMEMSTSAEDNVPTLLDATSDRKVTDQNADVSVPPQHAESSLIEKNHIREFSKILFGRQIRDEKRIKTIGQAILASTTYPIESVRFLHPERYAHPPFSLEAKKSLLLSLSPMLSEAETQRSLEVTACERFTRCKSGKSKGKNAAYDYTDMDTQCKIEFADYEKRYKLYTMRNKRTYQQDNNSLCASETYTSFRSVTILNECNDHTCRENRTSMTADSSVVLSAKPHTRKNPQSEVKPLTPKLPEAQQRRILSVITDALATKQQNSSTLGIRTPTSSLLPGKENASTAVSSRNAMLSNDSKSTSEKCNERKRKHSASNSIKRSGIDRRGTLSPASMRASIFGDESTDKGLDGGNDIHLEQHETDTAYSELSSKIVSDTSINVNDDVNVIDKLVSSRRTKRGGSDKPAGGDRRGTLSPASMRATLMEVCGEHSTEDVESVLQEPTEISTICGSIYKTSDVNLSRSEPCSEVVVESNEADYVNSKSKLHSDTAVKTNQSNTQDVGNSSSDRVQTRSSRRLRIDTITISGTNADTKPKVFSPAIANGLNKDGFSNSTTTANFAHSNRSDDCIIAVSKIAECVSSTPSQSNRLIPTPSPVQRMEVEGLVETVHEETQQTVNDNDLMCCSVNSSNDDSNLPDEIDHTVSAQDELSAFGQELDNILCDVSSCSSSSKSKSRRHSAIPRFSGGFSSPLITSNGGTGEPCQDTSANNVAVPKDNLTINSNVSKRFHDVPSTPKQPTLSTGTNHVSPTAHQLIAGTDLAPTSSLLTALKQPSPQTKLCSLPTTMDICSTSNTVDNSSIGLSADSCNVALLSPVCGNSSAVETVQIGQVTSKSAIKAPPKSITMPSKSVQMVKPALFSINSSINASVQLHHTPQPSPFTKSKTSILRELHAGGDQSDVDSFEMLESMLQREFENGNDDLDVVSDRLAASSPFLPDAASPLASKTGSSSKALLSLEKQYQSFEFRPVAPVNTQSPSTSSSSTIAGTTKVADGSPTGGRMMLECVVEAVHDSDVIVTYPSSPLLDESIERLSPLNRSRTSSAVPRDDSDTAECSNVAITSPSAGVGMASLLDRGSRLLSPDHFQPSLLEDEEQRIKERTSFHSDEFGAHASSNNCNNFSDKSDRKISNMEAVEKFDEHVGEGVCSKQQSSFNSLRCNKPVILSTSNTSNVASTQLSALSQRAAHRYAERMAVAHWKYCWEVASEHAALYAAGIVFESYSLDGRMPSALYSHSEINLNSTVDSSSPKLHKHTVSY